MPINGRHIKSVIGYGFLFVFVGCIMVYGQKPPKTYIAHTKVDAITIDGKADEVSWSKAQWSEPFVDIKGEQRARYDTRMKMVWDQTHIYFFAQLEEPHVWATLKQRDTIIFYNNDFEIFIDPDGDTHNYYEFEVNALNTVWDLFLSKPYRNHGKVLGAWDAKGLQTAVHVEGTLNDASDVDKGWSLEIAIPWSFFTDPGRTDKVPENEFWRLNFSRVNWDFDLINGAYSRKKDKETGKFLHEHNWVWSPQEVINMHEPERWGYVYFSNQSVGDSDTFTIPNDEHIKWYLYELYRDYRAGDKQKKHWLFDGDNAFVEPKDILGKSITPILETHRTGFNLWVKSPFTNMILNIDEDGKYTNSKL